MPGVVAAGTVTVIELLIKSIPSKRQRQRLPMLCHKSIYPVSKRVESGQSKDASHANLNVSCIVSIKHIELGRHRGREGKKECVLCGDECERVSHTLWDCSAYTSIRAQFLVKLKASLGGSYARFETMSSLDKSSFVLGNELWEEHFESLLALVKAYIIDIWEERKSKLYGDVECAQQPRPHSPTGDLGKIAGVNRQNSEGMCQGGKPGTGKLYTDVCLCCSAHTSGCMVDGLGATAAF